DRSGIEYLVARAGVAIRAIRDLKVAFVGSHPVIRTILDIHEDLGVSPHEWHRFENLEDARRFVSGRQSAGA
ncbi:MAG: hypothetical protein JNM82_04770, partial [Rhodocyclaceae bacterium]|nr:hypothetical protein [Rhodocyclaceae bacterium]